MRAFALCSLLLVAATVQAQPVVGGLAPSVQFGIQADFDGLGRSRIATRGKGDEQQREGNHDHDELFHAFLLLFENHARSTRVGGSDWGNVALADSVLLSWPAGIGHQENSPRRWSAR